LARDTMHQNQWAAAVKELQEDGLEEMPVPSNFPQKKEATEHSYTHYEFSDGQATAQGSWAAGPTPDGKGEFSYSSEPPAGVPMPPPTHPDSRFYGTTEVPNRVEKLAGTVQDKLHRE
ncbi:manganese catalase family protein, partial [Micrococcus luteus]|nr:manganese catalase family protein [Micrococcus luteus]